ncbi:hypothetical protein C3K47_13320 [Solitalea longa]|uniref:Outer membrane protein beta-barrel domain-containing protein n=1 Tax=Solitalea longa TaxID=2079460 RepID=A0A2S4ZZK9_9SPHI|nr:hypothetical protein [Solitalea longa]POY35735.1 hypothetical protein C3K47_13320 [Solitalea longa]
MKYLLFFYLFILSTAECFAQSDTSKATLTLAAVFSSNANYYGQTSDEQMPLGLVNATYRFPIGLYFSSNIYHLFNTPTPPILSLEAGYDATFSEKLKASVSFNHSFFPKNSPVLQASNYNTLGASLTYSYWLSTTLGADYAFGKQQDVFITLGNSKSFELGSLIDQNDAISIEPAIELVGGTQQFYQTYITYKNNKNKSPKNNGSNNSNSTEITYVPNSRFSFLSCNFKLPLNYSRDRYLIETSYQFSVLGKNDEIPLGTSHSFLGLSFYYQF